MSDERKWIKAALKFGGSDEAWAEFGTMERELSAARARIAELEKDSQRLRDINCTFEINHHRIVNELTAAAECGCGDLIPKSEFCHLCGKCQMGCCFCVSKKEHGELEAERDALQSRLDEANAWIGEQSNTPSGAIIARLEKQLVELIAERDALQTELAEECARAESNYSSLEPRKERLEMARLYVGNLSYNTTEEGLSDFVQDNGFEVQDCAIVTDRETGRARGFGFVTLKDASELRRAITVLNGGALDGRKLTINEARPQQRRERR